MFSKDKSAGIKLYKEFVLKENSEDITRILGRIRVPPVLGDEKFMKTVKERFFKKKPIKRCLSPSRWPRV